MCSCEFELSGAAWSIDLARLGRQLLETKALPTAQQPNPLPCMALNVHAAGRPANRIHNFVRRSQAQIEVIGCTARREIRKSVSYDDLPPMFIVLPYDPDDIAKSCNCDQRMPCFAGNLN